MFQPSLSILGISLQGIVQMLSRQKVIQENALSQMRLKTGELEQEGRDSRVQEIS